MPMNIMKTFTTILVALFVACICQAQPNQPGTPGSPAVATTVAKEPSNYIIHIEWKDAKGDTKSLEVLTTEGHVEFSGMQKDSVKINNTDVPITLKLSGTLNVLSDEKGRLQFYLGRTVPYVTGTSSGSGPATSSYSQMSVGLQSTVIVKFDKPVVIQSDENGTITILVKRLAD